MMASTSAAFAAAGAREELASRQLQQMITSKLIELLGEEEVEILTEYVWHMIMSPRRSEVNISAELQEFLGEDTSPFVSWLLATIVPKVEEGVSSIGTGRGSGGEGTGASTPSLGRDPQSALSSPSSPKQRVEPIPQSQATAQHEDAVRQPRVGVKEVGSSDHAAPEDSREGKRDRRRENRSRMFEIATKQAAEDSLKGARGAEAGGVGKGTAAASSAAMPTRSRRAPRRGRDEENDSTAVGVGYPGGASAGSREHLRQAHRDHHRRHSSRGSGDGAVPPPSSVANDIRGGDGRSGGGGSGKRGVSGVPRMVMLASASRGRGERRGGSSLESGSPKGARRALSPGRSRKYRGRSRSRERNVPMEERHGSRRVRKEENDSVPSGEGAAAPRGRGLAYGAPASGFGNLGDEVNAPVASVNRVLLRPNPMAAHGPEFSPPVPSGPPVSAYSATVQRVAEAGDGGRRHSFTHLQFGGSNSGSGASPGSMVFVGTKMPAYAVPGVMVAGGLGHGGGLAHGGDYVMGDPSAAGVPRPPGGTDGSIGEGGFGVMIPDHHHHPQQALMSAPLPFGPPTAAPPRKQKKRCSHWPNCQFGDDCKFIHPAEACTNWPHCQYGAKCFYIHPDVPCKFGLGCLNFSCNYGHPQGWSGGAGWLCGLNGGGGAAGMLGGLLGGSGMKARTFKNKKFVLNGQIPEEPGNAAMTSLSASMPLTPPDLKSGVDAEDSSPQSRVKEELPFSTPNGAMVGAAFNGLTRSDPVVPAPVVADTEMMAA